MYLSTAATSWLNRLLPPAIPAVGPDVKLTSPKKCVLRERDPELHRCTETNKKSKFTILVWCRPTLHLNLDNRFPHYIHYTTTFYHHPSFRCRPLVDSYKVLIDLHHTKPGRNRWQGAYPLSICTLLRAVGGLAFATMSVVFGGTAPHHRSAAQRSAGRGLSVVGAVRSLSYFPRRAIRVGWGVGNSLSRGRMEKVGAEVDSNVAWRNRRK